MTDAPQSTPTPPVAPGYYPSLEGALPDLVAGGIASRTLFRAKGLKVTLFRFDAGQGMTEHTSGHAATLHVLEGSMHVRVGEHSVTMRAGSFLGLEPRAPHALDAEEPSLLLLCVSAP